MKIARNVVTLLLVVAGVALWAQGPGAFAEAKAAPAKAAPAGPVRPEGEGWQGLFNGKDLTGWQTTRKLTDATKDVWRVVDGTIDCTPARGGPSLKTEKEFGDYVLRIEWRFKRTEGKYRMPILLPDGSSKKDANGKVIIVPTPNADSGIYVRGTGKSQINLWCWPCGSGEMWGVRNDRKAPPEVRAAAVPKVKADKPVGEWNAMEITMQGDRVTVVLNGKTVIEKAQIPGVPKTGGIVLQHHGGYNPKSKTWGSASSLIQFRNIWIKPLGGTAKVEVRL